MCDNDAAKGAQDVKTVPLHEAVGMVLAHDITEIRKDEFTLDDFLGLAAPQA